MTYTCKFYGAKFAALGTSNRKTKGGAGSTSHHIKPATVRNRFRFVIMTD